MNAGLLSKPAKGLILASGLLIGLSTLVSADTGTVSLANGKSFSFTTHALASQKDAGLFRSEQTVGKARYLAGWVLPAGPAAAEQGPAAAAQAGGIINEQTGAVLPAPVLTSQDIAAGQVMVPGLGMFPLTRCSLGKCG